MTYAQATPTCAEATVVADITQCYISSTISCQKVASQFSVMPAILLVNLILLVLAQAMWAN